MKRRINELEAMIEDPRVGLPEEIFRFVTSITPMINVDLLIKNQQNHTLLTWRDDGLCNPGWHVPGGIVRYKESMVDRIHAVAANELGAQVKAAPAAMAIHEVINPSRRLEGTSSPCCTSACW